MRKLIAIAALGLSLSYSLSSFADTNVFGVNVPVSRNEVSDQAKGGDVEESFISFYLSPKVIKNEQSQSPASKWEDESGYTVFGVRIMSTQNS